MKKLIAMLLMMSLLCAAALAEITVGVDWVEGKECYVVIKTDDVFFSYEENGRYETETGLVWQAEPIPFGGLRSDMLPVSEEQVRSLNALYAALDDASGFWRLPVTGEGSYAVYSAPDENSFRGADGKASVELPDGVKLLMTWGDWSLIEYEVSAGANRIGWVKSASLGAAPVLLTDVPVSLAEGAFLTDDPRGGERSVADGGELSDVHLLARLDAFWGYVSAKRADGQAVWGFVPLRDVCLNDVVDEAYMKEMAGRWQFASGGNLLPDEFTLRPDGTATIGDSEAQWAVVTGTAGYQHDLRVTFAEGRMIRLHIHTRGEGGLTLTQGEAGGTWRMAAE